MSPTSRLRLACKLSLLALALGACAAPTASPAPLSTSTSLPPTAAPTQRPTATTMPPTSASLSTATAAGSVALPATSVKLRIVNDVAIDGEGNLFLAQCQEISKIDAFGLLATYAGSGAGTFYGDGGPALLAGISCAAGLAFDPAGNLIVADMQSNRIRRIDRNGIITTVAGSGDFRKASYPDEPDQIPGGFAGDGGPGTEALLYAPTELAIDGDGNVYIVDSFNHCIRKLDRQGIISTVAGTGTAGFSGDGGPATLAQLNLLASSVVGVLTYGIAVDAEGNLYLSDSGNNRVRKVDRQGLITTIAGTDGPAVAGDGGPATEAVLTRTGSLAFDAEGNLYVATGPTPFINDSRIRKIDRDGLITTVVGTGAHDFSGDGGLATASAIRFPGGLAFDETGNLYFSDSANRVRRVDKAGILTTVAGGRP